MEKQTTIKNSVSLSGIGLHTGNQSTMIFKPAEANIGYVFVREIDGKRFEIPAVTEYVSDLVRGTTLCKDGIKVHTVEHVLAALAGLGIDNCYIELTANEPPVLDGSAKYFVESLISAGIEELAEDREYFIVEETIEYHNEQKKVDIVALPTDDYRITVMIDYFNPALGSQHTGMFDMKNEFVKEFSSARTFSFLSEIEAIYEQGLIKGGNLDCSLVIVDKEVTEDELIELKTVFKLDEVPTVGKYGSILNEKLLRYPNEPARHKLLDMIGDLALAGVRIKAQILAARPGHASNFEFAKMIRKRYLEQKERNRRIPNPKKGFTLDANAIKDILPHRYPFLLVDRVIDFSSKDRSIMCLKNVTINEDFFNGHFPIRPIMPGVLIIEGMAQTGGLLLFNDLPKEKVENKIALFMSIKKARFKKTVTPGDTIIYDVRIIGEKFNIYSFDCKAYVDGDIVAEAEISAALVDK
jgi:UDP-3-O-[3-hydroxymyristoyl] N-acetylglucosamine deacetylase/3-hydroxyacyl-[acyl-carrier-protein] dehydratase